MEVEAAKKSRRSRFLHVRLDPAEAAKLQELSGEMGIPQSSLIRYLILEKRRALGLDVK